MSTSILGDKIDFPICVAPTAVQKLAHPDGEIASAKGNYVRPNYWQSCQVSRFTRESPGFRADLQVSRLVLKISRIPLKWSFMHGLAPAPPVCWANQASRAIFAPQSGNIGLL